MKRKILLECSLCDWTETIDVTPGFDNFSFAEMAAETHSIPHGPSGHACVSMRVRDVSPHNPNPILNPHQWVAFR